MQKRIKTMLLILGCFLLLMGCGKVKQTNTAAEGSSNPDVSVSPVPTIAPEVGKPITIILYYGNENGDELVPKEVTLEPSTNTSQYLETLNALTKSSDEKAIALFDGFTFHSADLKDSTLNIDLTLPTESKLGAPGEDLLLQSLKKTLFQFKELSAIEVLVDGKKVESLLGHVELPHPILK
jgi:ABC-type glycerol-3-phosphate transport system substrate-binding protein